MARRALERPVQNGSQTSRAVTVPAPVGGWNTRDPSSSLQPQFAVVLDNFIPRERDLQLRAGSLYWTNATVGFNPRSLLTYNPVGGPEQLFACSGTGVFNITNPGVVPASSLAITNPDDWQFINFSNTAGTHLYAANGQEVIYYDGAWVNVTGASVPALTGTPILGLFGPMVHKRRIWFLKGMSTWYLAPNAIGGALTEFVLGPNFREGGTLVAQGSWTIDAGDGADDYAVFVTSEGEVAVYEGTDPATPGDFILRGVFRVPKPIGRKCLQKFGGDLLILTEQGIFPLSKALQSSSISRVSSITDRIYPSFRVAAEQYPNSAGWRMLLLTSENLLLANIPTQVGSSPITVQFVQNTSTGAWCRFVGFSAYDMVEFGKRFMYSGGGRVVQGLVGMTEATGEPIPGEFQTSFNYLGSQVGQKHIKLIRPQILVTSEILMFMSISTDYATNPDFQTALVERLQAVSAGGIWDSAIWDSDFWAYDSVNILEWKTIFSNPGFCASIGVRVQAANTMLRCTAVDLLVQDGFVL